MCVGGGGGVCAGVSKNVFKKKVLSLSFKSINPGSVAFV